MFVTISGFGPDWTHYGFVATKPAFLHTVCEASYYALFIVKYFPVRSYYCVTSSASDPALTSTQLDLPKTSLKAKLL